MRNCAAQAIILANRAMDDLDREQLIDRIVDAPDQTTAFQSVIDLIKEIRQLRAKNRVPHREVMDVTLDITNPEELRIVHQYKAFIERMTKSRLYFIQPV